MRNTVDGDDNLVLQCRTDGRMIPNMYGRQIVPAVAKQKNTAGCREVFTFRLLPDKIIEHLFSSEKLPNELFC